MKKILLIFGFFFLCLESFGQSVSVVREWNNFILEAIRNDYARPTVHARNLYHHSIIAYDAWAAYDPTKKMFFLGDTLHGFICDFDGIALPSASEIESSRHKAISFASYRLILYRYQNSPGFPLILQLINDYMVSKSYDVTNNSIDYQNGGPAELGNYLANRIIQYGLTDGANEIIDFQNTFYSPSNPPIEVEQPGNPDIVDPNHWQAISLTLSIDQSGNVVSSTPEHLSPEWGEVQGFALADSMYDLRFRDGSWYKVYFDPGDPALLNVGDSVDWDSFYKWNHTLVSIWQSHLDTSDNVMWDISPASIGNNIWYPSTPAEYPLFYDLINGGDPGTGYAINPITGMPYTPQIVPRADYARVLAEFWADGLDSETPPGHWFEIYHTVSDHPMFERKWQGIGPELDQLEYDVKAHLALGGAMHDAAISAWSVKGYYDYVRPVSAIRYMADQGQSSDPMLPSYDPNGIPLMTGFVELVTPGDPLSGQWGEHVGKIKLYTWRGHEYINDPATDQAGVGWILAENWWPYQRPSFVTPPFAGYVSGHSTFSRAASVILSEMTGSDYFPGGLGEFTANQNEFLHFEEGPSDTIVLQWATYRDAADQCSLSRLWGGIHPPVDDIPGRMIGQDVGQIGFDKADSLFSIDIPGIVVATISDSIISEIDELNVFTVEFTFNTPMDTSAVYSVGIDPGVSGVISIEDNQWIDSTTFQLHLKALISDVEIDSTLIKLSNFSTASGFVIQNYSFSNLYVIDTKPPSLVSASVNDYILNDQSTTQQVILELVYDDNCDTSSVPSISFQSPSYTNPSLILLQSSSSWISANTYQAIYSFNDWNEEVTDLMISVSGVADFYQNVQNIYFEPANFVVDTKNPKILSHNAIDTLITQEDLTSPSVQIGLTFDNAMDTSLALSAEVWFNGSAVNFLSFNPSQSTWTDEFNCTILFDLFGANLDLSLLDLHLSNLFDTSGNILMDSYVDSVLYVDLKSPNVDSIIASNTYISDSIVGTSLYSVDVYFSEKMDTTLKPLVKHLAGVSLSNSIQYNIPQSSFLNDTTYRAYYNVLDENIEVSNIAIQVNYGRDVSGNDQLLFEQNDFQFLDTRNPNIVTVLADEYVLNSLSQELVIYSLYDEEMFLGIQPDYAFSPGVDNGLIQYDPQQSGWLYPNMHRVVYNYSSYPNNDQLSDVAISNAVDTCGNAVNYTNIIDFVSLEVGELNMKFPSISHNVLVYPIPCQSGDKLKIRGTDFILEPQLNYSLYDLSGKEVGNLMFTYIEDHWESERMYLPPGAYILKIDTHNFNVIIK